jgi:hypothetical protein
VYTAVRHFNVNAPPACSVENMTTDATYTDVQAAIDAATTGDELDITGTCTGSFSIIQKTVDLKGTTASPQAAIIGSLTIGTGSFEPGHSTVTNLKIADGSGVFISPDSTAVLKDSLVTGNSNPANGGGIDIVRGSLTLDNSDVTNNTSLAEALPPFGCPGPPTVQPGRGGGISAAGTPFVGANITLKGDSDITGNTAQPGLDCDGTTVLPGDGGAIFQSGAASTLTFDSWTGEISGNSPSTDQCDPDRTLPDSSVCQ